MLTAFESNVFAALRHRARRAGATTNDGSDRSAFTTTCDRADDRADTGSCADLRCVVFRRVASLNSAFSINLRIVFATHRRDLNQLRVQRGGAIVSGTNLIKRQLQLGDAFNFSGSLECRDSSFDYVA